MPSSLPDVLITYQVRVPEAEVGSDPGQAVRWELRKIHDEHLAMGLMPSLSIQAYDPDLPEPTVRKTGVWEVRLFHTTKHVLADTADEAISTCLELAQAVYDAESHKPYGDGFTYQDHHVSQVTRLHEVLLRA